MAKPPALDSELKGPWWREMKGHHWWVLLVATLGWLFDGMDQRLFILTRTPALKDLLPTLSDPQIASYAGLATTIFIFGWATGGLVFGLLGDRLGRTRTMMITILIYSLFTGLSALARSWPDFALYRFLCGMGIGGEYAAGVALVAEVMPSRARPYCLGLLQGLGAIGHLIGSLVSLAIGPQAELHGIAGWRLLFLVGIFPALLVVLIRWRLQEPEAWQKAKQSANRAGPIIEGDTADELHKKMGDVREIFRNRTLLFHTLIGMTLGMAGQTGLWGIGYWTPELIRNSLLEERRQQLVAHGRSVPTGQTDEFETLDLPQLARQSAGTETEAQQLAKRWKAENDRLVGRGTVLQDMAGMFGIYAFTWFTGIAGRRPAFVISYLLAFGATLLTFGRLNEAADVYWMIPILGFCVSSVYGGFAIYFPELFPTRLRSTGTGFCYNVARYLTALGPLTLGKLTVLFAGLGYAMPLRPAAMTLSMIYLVGVAAVYFAPETKGKPLPD